MFTRVNCKFMLSWKGLKRLLFFNWIFVYSFCFVTNHWILSPSSSPSPSLRFLGGHCKLMKNLDSERCFHIQKLEILARNTPHLRIFSSMADLGPVIALLFSAKSRKFFRIIPLPVEKFHIRSVTSSRTYLIKYKFFGEIHI